MTRTCPLSYILIHINEGVVETPMFTIKAPHFPDAEQYEFIWENIKTAPNPIENYTFC